MSRSIGGRVSGGWIGCWKGRRTNPKCGVPSVSFGPARLGVVTHLDVSTEDVERAADIIARVLDREGG